MPHINWWEAEDDQPKQKVPFITGTLIKAIVEAIVDGLVASGKIHENREGYNPEKDLPKDKDTGDSLH